MFKLRSTYLISASILLAIEILIALFCHDSIIRPFVGDFLVVILLYCLVKSFVQTDDYIAALGVLLFSYLIEILQLFDILNILGLKNSPTARILMETSFSWIDMLMYTWGMLVIWSAERMLYNLNSNRTNTTTL
ncbi:DUF2809 domain-containing protein [Pedobacter sp. HMF7647]|uniref:DUF2809 domain-containing protein n=1 Tax=Hufsiella arboris TaxID=2695275 RepID=A0A7K1YCR0_9SPHI|nr:DUF2809 domain-containing protein [Hufsiella arboris]MXV51828.1 DUF2809 domain-containing protein [Hufsiella arboris]